MHSVLRKTLYLCFGLCLMWSLSGIFSEAGAGQKKARWDILPDEAKQLYKDWSDFMGQTSLEMVEENDPAPEITPGTVITPDNAADFPNLRKVLPEPLFKRISSRDTYAHIEEMEIVETRPWYLSREILEETRKNANDCRIEPGTRQLLNWELGIPFPFPKDGTELMFNCLLNFIGMTPEYAMEPVTIVDLDSSGQHERTRRFNLYVLMIMGRQHDRVNPKHMFPGYEYGDIYAQSSIVFTYPQDMKGMSFVRTRYWDVNKPDRFVGYIPSMRRIRTLSGSDAQDPVAGSEFTWDMWGGEWQKQPSNTIFPNEYKLLGEKTLLLPVLGFKPSYYLEGDQAKGHKWEKRRVYVLEITSRDPTYYYSRRIEYVDKENLRGTYFEYYDRRGNLWRTWNSFMWIEPKSGLWIFEGTDIVNWVDHRRTIQLMNSTFDPQHVNPDYFNLKFLSREVR